jgi:hypothetical protein
MNTAIVTTAPTVSPFIQNLQQQQTKQPQTSKEVIAANVKALIEQLEEGHSEGLTAYLTAMGRFHNYSFGNILEIARQKPVTYCYTSLESVKIGVCGLPDWISGDRRPVWTSLIRRRTAGRSRSVRLIVHGANFTICRAGKVFSEISLRTTISLTPSI